MKAMSSIPPSCSLIFVYSIAGKFVKNVNFPANRANLSYSTLFSDSTISIFLSLKYITPLTKKENPNVIRKL